MKLGKFGYATKGDRRAHAVDAPAGFWAERDGVTAKARVDAVERTAEGLGAYAAGEFVIGIEAFEKRSLFALNIFETGQRDADHPQTQPAGCCCDELRPERIERGDDSETVLRGRELDRSAPFAAALLEPGVQHQQAGADVLAADTFRSFEVYIVAAGCYLLLSLLMRIGFWAIGQVVFTRKRRLGTTL